MKFTQKIALLLAAVGSIEAHDVKYGGVQERAEMVPVAEEKHARGYHPAEQRAADHHHPNNLRHAHPEARCAVNTNWVDDDGWKCEDYSASDCEGWANYPGTGGVLMKDACCLCSSSSSPVSQPTAPSPVAQPTAASAPTISPGSAGTKATQWVDGHNTRRQRYANEWGYGYTAVGWNEDLAAQAQAWADYLLAKDCVDPDHAARTCLDSANEGENLAINWSSGTATTDINGVMTRWTEDEIAGDPSQAGHASQVLWKGSTTIGCGIAEGTCNNGNMNYAAVQVCRYYPAGNLNCNGHCIDSVKNKQMEVDTGTALKSATDMHTCLTGAVSSYP